MRHAVAKYVITLFHALAELGRSLHTSTARSRLERHTHSLLTMSPHRQLSQSSNRKPSAVQDIFLGFASSLAPAEPENPSKPRKLEYSVVLNDGTGVVESETYNFDFKVREDEDEAAAEVKRFGKEVLALIRRIQTNKGMNVGSGGVDLL